MHRLLNLPEHDAELPPGGMFFSGMMHEIIEIMGIDHSLFAVDYPFV